MGKPRNPNPSRSPVFGNRRRTWWARPQPDWMRDLQVGDVLECHGGRVQRIVRALSRYQCGALHSVTFTIKHCSWTGRCETLLLDTDLRCRGFQPVGYRVRLNKPLDRKIARNIQDHKARTLDCCDVKGVA